MNLIHLFNMNSPILSHTAAKSISLQGLLPHSCDAGPKTRFHNSILKFPLGDPTFFLTGSFDLSLSMTERYEYK